MSLTGYIFATAVAAASVPKDFGTFAECIALVESGGNYKAKGDNGKAFGAWQMHREAINDANDWLLRNRLPVVKPDGLKEREGQKMLAYAYLMLCKERMEKEGLKPDLGDIYLCYAMGFQGYKNCKFDKELVPLAKKDAMQRVLNLTNQRK
jgi:hypothetical protein